MTSIDFETCHSVAQLYPTTNYSLPLKLLYTAQTFLSWPLKLFYTTQTFLSWPPHTLRTEQGTEPTRLKLFEIWSDRFYDRRSKIFSFVQTCGSYLHKTFYKPLRLLALDYKNNFILPIENFIFYEIDRFL